MDLTLVDSIKAFTTAYNLLYQDYPDFEPADPNNINCYSFRNICPLIDSPLPLFEHYLFFQNLELIDEYTYSVLDELKHDYQLIIATIGTPINLSNKAIYLKQNLPFIQDYILLYNGDIKMDKSLIDMSGGIFIDDIPSNLRSTNADKKIQFGEIFPWNNDWEGEHCSDWREVRHKLIR